MRVLHAFALAAGLLGATSLNGAAGLGSGAAQAAMREAFTTAAFEAAKAKGPVLVEVTAPWCPTCKAQKPILSDLLAGPKFADMTVLTVDFDSQKDALTLLGVTMQSTLITYSNGQEVGRSTGQTGVEAIRAQLDKSL